jgi:signal transduction histidine kinase
VRHRVLCSAGRLLVWREAGVVSDRMVHGPVGREFSVVVCDGSPVIRDAIRSLLDVDGRFGLAGEAVGRASCLQSIRHARPDILIVDATVDQGGPELVRAVRQCSADTQILVHSTVTKRRCGLLLDAGADDLLPKNGRIGPLLDGLYRAVGRLEPCDEDSALTASPFDRGTPVARFPDVTSSPVPAGRAAVVSAFGSVVFTTTATSMIIIDDHLTIALVNPVMAGLLGAGTTSGRSVVDLFIEDPAAPGTGPLATFLLRAPTGAERLVVLAGETAPVVGYTLRVLAREVVAGTRLTLLKVGARTGGTGRLTEDLVASEWRLRQVVASIPGLSVLAFDHHLRVQIAAGEALRRGGFDGEAIVGRLLSDALPAASLNRLDEPFRAALAGRASNLSYRSPVDGRFFRLRVQPLVDRSGAVIGGLSMAQDTSADMAGMAQLEHLQRLGAVGGGWYDLLSGWTFDDHLLALLGVESNSDAALAFESITVCDEHGHRQGGFLASLTTGADRTAQGSFIDPRTGQVRHIFGTGHSVHEDDKLLHAVITVTDITVTVIEREKTQHARLAAAQARALLLRRVGDAFATGSMTLLELMHNVTDTAAAIGEGAVVRILTQDGLGIETQLISHPDPATKDSVEAFLEWNARALDRPSGSLHEPGERTDDVGETDRGSGTGSRPPADAPAAMRHHVLASIRHAGQALGFLMVFRADPEYPYESSDEDILQELANRLGAAVAQHRVHRVVEEHCRERRAIAEQLAELTVEQQELLEQLAEVGERERNLLAEAIHDDPMQLIVASILRMDSLQTRLPAAEAEELDKLAAMLQQSVEQLRTLVIALTPADLTDGIGIALRDLAGALFVGTTTAITLTDNPPGNIDPATATCIYRVLREALMNARKHANASTITISVNEDDDHIVTSLTDDGVGAAAFDAGPGHLGVATMHARARSAGGHLTIDSAPGAGTTITLTLPTKHSLESAARYATGSADLSPGRPAGAAVGRR